MAVDLNAYTPARYPVDGAIANSNTPATRHLQGMIYRAFSAGGGIVELPAGAGTLVLDDTINLLTGVDLWIPKGCQIQVPPGFNQAIFLANGVTDVRIFGGGWIVSQWDFTLTLNVGIQITNSQEVFVEGVRIAGMGGSGIVIDGDGYNHVTRALIHDNGLHGVYLTNATARNKISDAWVYSNGQQGGATGDGVHLDGATVRTLITNLHAFDPAASYAAAQAYPVREASGSACDYTFVVGMLASGNVTSDSPSFVGANSKWLDSAATIALVGTPAAESLGASAVLGTSLNAAPLDHVHALPVSSVGASTKPLLNFVPATLVANAYPLTQLTGTGVKSATAFTLTGLPATAVAASIQLVFLPGSGFAVGDGAGLLQNVSQVSAGLVVRMEQATLAVKYVDGVIPVTAGASNQLAYLVNQITGGDVWQISVVLLGWYEPV